MSPTIINTVTATDHEILGALYNFFVWSVMTTQVLLLLTILFIGVKWVIPVWWYKK